MNGSNDREGRVEVFYNGEWGTICNDHFDIRDAEVICQMMDFPGASLLTLTGGLELEVPLKKFGLMTYGVAEMKFLLLLVHSEDGDHIIVTIKKMLV